MVINLLCATTAGIPDEPPNIVQLRIVRDELAAVREEQAGTSHRFRVLAEGVVSLRFRMDMVDEPTYHF